MRHVRSQDRHSPPQSCLTSSSNRTEQQESVRTDPLCLNCSGKSKETNLECTLTRQRVRSRTNGPVGLTVDQILVFTEILTTSTEADVKLDQKKMQQKKAKLLPKPREFRELGLSMSGGNNVLIVAL